MARVRVRQRVGVGGSALPGKELKVYLGKREEKGCKQTVPGAMHLAES